MALLVNMLKMGRINEKENTIYNFRPNADPGCWLLFLLPTAILISVSKYSVLYTDANLLLMCVDFIGASSVIFLRYVKKKKLVFPTKIEVAFMSIFLSTMQVLFAKGNLIPRLCQQMYSIISYCVFHKMILKSFPFSFTVGEAGIVSQALVLFVFSTIKNILYACYQVPVKKMHIATIIIQIGLTGVGIICLLSYTFKWFRKTSPLYLLMMLVFAFVIVAPLHILLKQSPLLWILLLIFEETETLKMVAYWSICSAAACICLNIQITRAKKASTIVRKIFHLLAVAVFIPGLLYQCTLLYLASGIILGLFILLELLRILNIPPLGIYLQEGFAVYSDEKDVGPVALTPIYLLAGCSLPLWIHPVPCDVTDSAGFNLLPLLSGIIAIGIGDTSASILGSQIGRFKWPGTKKTVEGTLGCIFSQLSVIFALRSLGYLEMQQHEHIVAIVAVLVASIIEAKTNQIDNLILPLIMFIILSNPFTYI